MQCFDWLTRLRRLGCQIEVNAYGSIVEHDEDDEGHVRTEMSEPRGEIFSNSRSDLTVKLFDFPT